MAKLTSKKSRAIAALLEERTIQKAAASVGIGETTLHRWLSDVDFQAVYREAKKRIVSHAVTRLQHCAGEAVEALVGVIRDKEKPVGSRVSASKIILEIAMKAVESEDVLTRIEEIERWIKDRKR